MTKKDIKVLFCLSGESPLQTAAFTSDFLIDYGVVLFYHRLIIITEAAIVEIWASGGDDDGDNDDDSNVDKSADDGKKPILCPLLCLCRSYIIQNCEFFSHC